MPKAGDAMEVKRSFFTTFSHAFESGEVEEVDCNLCRSNQYDELGTELGFHIRQCLQCGLIYVSPQPTAAELPRFYEGMYTDDSDEAVEMRSLGYIEKHLSRIIKRRKPQGGRLLEIGCGYGALLRAIADQPWKVTAVEMSGNALDYAREHCPNVEFHQGSLEDAEFRPESQDCVVLIAVLEHVKDPAAAIQRMASWLAPGGLLLIQVPYVGPYIRLKRWLPWLPIYFEAPRHLFDFSPKTLPEYLRRAGFENIHTEIARPYSAPTPLSAALIWMIKIPGLVLYHLTGGRYIYPFASAITVHAIKR